MWVHVGLDGAALSPMNATTTSTWSIADADADIDVPAIPTQRDGHIIRRDIHCWARMESTSLRTQFTRRRRKQPLFDVATS